MRRVRYGLLVMNFGDSYYTRNLAELVRDAEEREWDGFFMCDTIIFHRDGREPLAEVFTALAAISMNTSRIRVRTSIAALPYRLPWTVARETASFDHLSNGRLTLGVGLEGPTEAEFETFGECR